MKPQSPFLSHRAETVTRLSRKGPAPSSGQVLSVPDDAKRLVYPSDGVELLAYLELPGLPENGPYPGVVFSHGGCEIKTEHFDKTRVFLEAGFAVFSPSYRGEHGNPGSFELFYGEVTDALAAVAWFAAQPFVDSDRVYAFGHSMGGEIAALLSLFPNTPLRLTGSCGPFFLRSNPFGLDSMYGLEPPFDADDPAEVEARLLRAHLGEMTCDHVAYIGDDDEKFADGGFQGLETAGAKLAIERVPGDHDASVFPAARAFTERIRVDWRA